MRIPRPAAEKLGGDRQDPDLDGLLLGLIRRVTGGCHEHAARLAHPQVGGAGRGLTNDHGILAGMEKDERHKPQEPNRFLGAGKEID